jgi:hypothetical protein
MRFTKIFTAAIFVGSASLLSVAPATSAPLLGQPNLSSAVPPPNENVQYRRYGYRGGSRYGYRGGYGGYRRGYGGGAVLGGLAAGAIIGGAVAAGAAANAAANNNAAYCAQRFRSSILPRAPS